MEVTRKWQEVRSGDLGRVSEITLPPRSLRSVCWCWPRAAAFNGPRSPP